MFLFCKDCMSSDCYHVYDDFKEIQSILESSVDLSKIHFVEKFPSLVTKSMSETQFLYNLRYTGKKILDFGLENFTSLITFICDEEILPYDEIFQKGKKVCYKITHKRRKNLSYTVLGLMVETYMKPEEIYSLVYDNNYDFFFIPQKFCEPPEKGKPKKNVFSVFLTEEYNLICVKGIAY